MNGETLEQLGWVRWQGLKSPVWLYKSARLIWSVKDGFMLNGRKTDRDVKDLMNEMDQR